MPERDEHALKVRDAGKYQGYFDFDKEYLQSYEHHNYYK
jgi:hypothetical protein